MKIHEPIIAQGRDIQKEFDAIYKIVEPMQRGEVLLRGQIEQATGFSSGTYYYQRVVFVLKRRMLERVNEPSIVLKWCAKSQGYRLLDAKSQACKEPERHLRIARKRFGRIAIEAGLVGNDELSIAERNLRDSHVAHASRMIEETRQKQLETRRAYAELESTATVAGKLLGEVG